MLTSTATGATGVDLVDGSQGIARQLGWLDSTTAIKHATSAGAGSDQFASSSATVASQLGTTSTGPQTIIAGGHSVTINLGTDSLTDIANRLTTAGLQATVQSTTVDGATKYSLDIRNTTSFTDAGNTLEQLGVLKNGRGSETQQVAGDPLTVGGTAAAAVASTLITALGNGGTAGGASVGDTLTIRGTRGDGTAVNTTFTVGATSTVQDLLSALNDPTTGFGSVTRPVTAAIDASGRITVTDGTAGSSALAVQVVANNEGGGRLDLGNFATTTAGRARTLAAGTDASFTIDGVAFTRSSNTVTDAIDGTTLTLMSADPTITANVSVDRSADTVRGTVQGYVDAYNKIIDYIGTQQTPGKDSSSNPTLYNDPLLRLTRSSLSAMMLQSVSGAASDLSTVGMAGVSLTKDGHVTLDADKFNAAFNTRFADLTAVFKESGVSSNPLMSYTSSTSATQGGTYAVNVTQAASQALVTGTGFSGTYTDDGTPDVLAVTDLATNYAAQIQLNSGMTTAQIVNALNSAMATPQPQVLRAGNKIYVSGGASATSNTLLTDSYSSASTSAGVTVGDTIPFSGTRADGSAFNDTFVVGPTSTLGDLASQIQSSLGSSATVSIQDGKLNVQATTPGASSLSLTVTPQNQGGGSLNFGGITTVTTGRGAMSEVASAVGNQIKILHSAFGAAAGFALSMIGGGSDNTSQLGLTAGNYRGTDVTGTIGGYAATGTGQQLVGDAGSPVDGLSLNYRDTALGSAGTLTLTQGIGATIDRLIKSWTDADTGIIAQKTTQLSNTVTAQQKRVDSINARLEVRRQSLLKQYLAMDTAVSSFKSQASSLTSLFASAQTSNS